MSGDRIKHGGCLGIGLAAMGTHRANVYEQLEKSYKVPYGQVITIEKERFRFPEALSHSKAFKVRFTVILWEFFWKYFLIKIFFSKIT